MVCATPFAPHHWIAAAAVTAAAQDIAASSALVKQKTVDTRENAGRAGPSEDAQACEARLGLANTTQRPDLPSLKEVERQRQGQFGGLRALPGYAELRMEDFKLYRSSHGFVALPVQEARLSLRLGGPAAGEVAGDPFWLTALLLRMPSEHRLQGRSFVGELQLVHRNNLGAAVVVSMLLEGLRQYKAVPYPADCPNLYTEIRTEDDCHAAALELEYIHHAAHAVRLRKFKSGHCVLGCYVSRYKDEYSLMLDPEIFSIKVGWGTTFQLCKVDRLVSDWMRELVKRSSDPDHAGVCNHWLGRALDSRCQASILPLHRLFSGSLPALRYDGSSTRVRPLRKDAARYTFKFHTRSDLGLSLNFTEEEPVVITGINPGGSVAKWNEQHPERRVRVGDHIVAVGGHYDAPQRLISELKQDQDVEVTVAATREIPNCSLPLEWLVLAAPLPVEHRGLQETLNMTANLAPLIDSQAALQVEAALEAEAELTEGLAAALDMASLTPPAVVDFQLPVVSLLQNSGTILLTLVLFILGFIAWGLLRGHGEYEPDLVESTRQACWPLVRAHAMACAVAWAAVPLLLGLQHLAHAGGKEWQLPFGSGAYVSVAVLAQLLLQLYYVEAAGSAKVRVNLLESLRLLAFDALAVVDLYLNLLFFCIAYLCGSPLCWVALGVFLLGHLVGQWLLGAALAAVACEEALLHWQPRQMGLMHAVVLRQLLALQREEEVRERCAWVALPALKCAVEDAPFALLQVVFLGYRRAAQPWVGLSAATSVASAARGAFLTVVQAQELELTADDVARALQTLLTQLSWRAPTARDCPGTARGSASASPRGRPPRRDE